MHIYKVTWYLNISKATLENYKFFSITSTFSFIISLSKLATLTNTTPTIIHTNSTKMANQRNSDRSLFHCRMSPPDFLLHSVEIKELFYYSYFNILILNVRRHHMPIWYSQIKEKKNSKFSARIISSFPYCVPIFPFALIVICLCFYVCSQACLWSGSENGLWSRSRRDCFH